MSARREDKETRARAQVLALIRANSIANEDIYSLYILTRSGQTWS
jgi:hypothetical protein